MKIRNRRSKIAGLPLLLILAVALVLTACGDAATATPIPPTATPIPPTATPTPPPATTSSAGATTGAGGTASSTGSFQAPTIPGVTEVTLDPSVVSAINQQLPGANLSVKFYVSDATADVIVGAADTALTGAGYAFSLPGDTKPTKQGDNYIGLYTKTGGSDVVLAAVAVPNDPSQLASTINLPGVTPDLVQKVVGQLKGKKSAMFIIAAPNLLQAIFNGLGGSSSSAVNPTATPAK